MNFIADKDGVRISGIINDRYEQTRRRITKFKHKQDMSDKEIIEYLTEEIEQYRERARKQEEYIKELKNKQTILDIRKDRIELKEIEQVEDEDIKEIETINKFVDGRLIQSISNYKYKETESTCPPIEIRMTKAY